MLHRELQLLCITGKPLEQEFGAYWDRSESEGVREGCEKSQATTAPSVSGGLVLWEGRGRCNWKCCNTLDCVALTFLGLVQVRHDDSKYGEIENLFQQTMKDYSISRLRRTWSPTLWQHFQLFVSALLHSPGGSEAFQIMAGPPSCPPQRVGGSPLAKGKLPPSPRSPVSQPSWAQAPSSGTDCSDSLIYDGKKTNPKMGEGVIKILGPYGIRPGGYRKFMFCLGKWSKLKTFLL